MQPLRCWKELIFGERAFKARKESRERRRFGSSSVMDVTVDQAVAGH
jgi:hypothetical protein